MRILHIGKYYKPDIGGIEKVTFDIVTGLQDDILQLDVLCHNKSFNTVHEIAGPCNIYRLGTWGTFASTPIIRYSCVSIMKRIIQNYDILHIHLPNPLLAILLLYSNYKGKIIIHWHSDIIRQKFFLFFFSFFQKRLLDKATLIIVTSPNYKDNSVFLKPYANKVTVVPLSVERTDITINPVIVNKIKSHYKRKIIFSVGRLVYYKGFDYLIKAAKHLPEDTVVLICGKGPEQKKLERLIDENHLQDKVNLLGYLTDSELGSYYEACDVFCLPSISKAESFGLVQLEAMILGKPVVSTRIKGSGVDWVNLNEVSGLTVEPANEKALALALNRILSDDDLYQKYSAGAKARIQKLFLRKNFINQLKEIYQSLLDD